MKAMLKVKLLEWGAELPTVGHAGSDLGFDLRALEDTILRKGEVKLVRTGIAASFSLDLQPGRKFGLVIKDRSSMAAKGFTVSAGVVDAGYTGEIQVLLTYNGAGNYKTPKFGYEIPGQIIKAGERIAQMLPIEVFTGESIVQVEDELGETTRGAGGFGSTGR